MSSATTREFELLRAAYAAFNTRESEAASVTTPDVEWWRAFKGGFVCGHQAIREYWTQQWSEIDPHVEPISFHHEGAAQVIIDVHQVIRDLKGDLLADEQVGHRFTIRGGLIAAMEVCTIPATKSP